MSTVDVAGVAVTIAGATIIEQISLSAPAGLITAVIGPNGSGKSTLLRTMYRHLDPSAGVVSVDERDIRSLSRPAAARLISAIAQERGAATDMTVYEAVALGRIPHQGALRANTAADRTAIHDALDEVGLAALAGRTLAGLSGGERQRVHLARAIAQDGAVLVLDEPTNHLDPAHQVRLLEILRRRARTTVITVHDLDIAATCDRVYVLSGGRVVVGGTPREVLTPEIIEQVYGVRVALVDNPFTGAPSIAVDYRGLP